MLYYYRFEKRVNGIAIFMRCDLSRTFSFMTVSVTSENQPIFSSSLPVKHEGSKLKCKRGGKD